MDLLDVYVFGVLFLAFINFRFWLFRLISCFFGFLYLSSLFGCIYCAVFVYFILSLYSWSLQMWSRCGCRCVLILRHAIFSSLLVIICLNVIAVLIEGLFLVSPISHLLVLSDYSTKGSSLSYGFSFNFSFKIYYLFRSFRLLMVIIAVPHIWFK